MFTNFCTFQNAALPPLAEAAQPDVFSQPITEDQATSLRPIVPHQSQLFPLPSTSHRLRLKSASILMIPNLSSIGWKLHLNPEQVLESSQTLCSCRIFGHSRPPFDGCWMMRRFRNCLNFTAFPAEKRRIRSTMTNIYLRKRWQTYMWWVR